MHVIFLIHRVQTFLNAPLKRNGSWEENTDTNRFTISLLVFELTSPQFWQVSKTVDQPSFVSLEQVHRQSRVRAIVSTKLLHSHVPPKWRTGIQGAAARASQILEGSNLGGSLERTVVLFELNDIQHCGVPLIHSKHLNHLLEEG